MAVREVALPELPDPHMAPMVRGVAIARVGRQVAAGTVVPFRSWSYQRSIATIMRFFGFLWRRLPGKPVGSWGNRVGARALSSSGGHRPPSGSPCLTPVSDGGRCPPY